MNKKSINYVFLCRNKTEINVIFTLNSLAKSAFFVLTSHVFLYKKVDKLL